MAFAILSGMFNGFNWITVLLAGFAVFGVLAIVSTFWTFLEIEEKQLTFRKNLVKRTIEKDEIKSVHSAKGCPDIILLTDGTKYELPEVGTKNVANSIWHWLKN